MMRIRKCDLYCEFFHDAFVELYCGHKKEKNIIRGEDCSYGLPEVSKIQKAKIDSNLEKTIKFQETLRKNPEHIKGPHNLKIVT